MTHLLQAWNTGPRAKFSCSSGATSALQCFWRPWIGRASARKPHHDARHHPSLNFIIRSFALLLPRVLSPPASILFPPPIPVFLLYPYPSPSIRRNSRHHDHLHRTFPQTCQAGGATLGTAPGLPRHGAGLPRLARCSRWLTGIRRQQDILTGDEILSDSFDLKEVDGIVYEADCAMITEEAVNVGMCDLCRRRLLGRRWADPASGLIPAASIVRPSIQGRQWLHARGACLGSQC